MATVGSNVRVHFEGGALKTQVGLLENASMEKASTKERISQGWKTHVRKMQVNANFQSDKKSLILHKLVWCIFKWGGQVDYRLVYSEITKIIRSKKSKGSQYSIAERRVPELIPVLGSQPAGDVSHRPGGRLPLLSARPAVTLATLKRAANNFAA